MAQEEEVVIPRFFKIFLALMSSDSLLIPSTFVEHLHNPLPKKMKLQGTGGKVWTVSLVEIRGQVYFTSGWSNFVEEHELKSGEFLTFVYDGHRIFEVSVYGRMGCKETRAVAPVVEIPDSDEEEDASNDSIGENDQISQSIYPVDSDVTEMNTNAAVFAGSSNLEVTGNLHFTTCLKNRTYEMLIPAHVVNEHNLKFGQTIKYIDVHGTLQGERAKWRDGRVSFKGWDRICRRNRVKDGDTVECEILHTDKLVHSVKINVQRAAP